MTGSTAHVELRLEVLQGPDRGKVLSFDGPTSFVFGRAGPPDKDLQLLTDAAVSREHVTIDITPGVVHVTPKSPMWIAGAPSQGADLTQGQQVQIGHTILQATWSETQADHDKAEPLLPRRPLDRYEVHDEIGRGAFGCVYEARDLETGERVAIKMFEPSDVVLHSNEHESVELYDRASKLFLRELDVVSALEHPNIVRTLAIGRSGDDMFLAMELIEGPSLFDRVAMSGPLLEPVVLHIADGLLAAIEYAHAQGIVHRDISPTNVMLTGPEERPVPRLLDFGFAKRRTAHTQGDLTKTGEVRGNMGFISPECLRDAKRAGRTTDLFSLGATLVYALTGRHWYGKAQGMTAVEAILAGQGVSILDDQRHVSPTLVACIERAMQPEPKDRWPNARAMRDAVRGGTPNEKDRVTD